MDGHEKTPQKNCLTPPPWKPPSRDRRFFSALIDLVIWATVLLVTVVTINALAHIALLGIPTPTEIRRYDYYVFWFSNGIGALCGNLYLAIANGAGRSVGKALTGLRLVIFVGQYPVRPGFARGLVRSGLQTGPYMGALMLLTGWHDTIAGTKIVQVADATAWDRWEAGSTSSLNSKAVFPNVPRPLRIAPWKITMAVLSHLFFAILPLNASINSFHHPYPYGWGSPPSIADNECTDISGTFSVIGRRDDGREVKSSFVMFFWSDFNQIKWHASKLDEANLVTVEQATDVVRITLWANNTMIAQKELRKGETRDGYSCTSEGILTRGVGPSVHTFVGYIGQTITLFKVSDTNLIVKLQESGGGWVLGTPLYVGATSWVSYRSVATFPPIHFSPTSPAP
jgi:hypothetical protein